MKIESQRFGSFDIGDADVIRMPAGLVGLPGETEFVLIRNAEESSTGWLQSALSSEIALPVAAIERCAPDYPALTEEELAAAGMPPGELVLMAVMSATGGFFITVNLLAPIVVNLEARVGAQIVRTVPGLSARAPFGPGPGQASGG